MREFDYDIINRYLDEEMSPDELKAFEEQMQQDDALRMEVELIRDINSTLKMKLHPGENEKALRRSLKETGAEYFSKQKTEARVIPISRKKWFIAAAAVLVLALILTVWSPWNKEDLYKQYASIQMPPVAERGAIDSLLRSAAQHFNEKKYAEAIPLFERVLKDSSQKVFAEYYYAIALLENGQTAIARDHFTSLYNGGSLFKYDAAFYMALSYLKEKNKDGCKEWLDKVPADTAPYEKAQELLKKL